MTDEERRLRGFLEAILHHGVTLWSDTSCGRGGVGGQAMTTTAHAGVVEHLSSYALHGYTLTQAADDYATMWPNTVRLDLPPKPPRRAGADGRPS